MLLALRPAAPPRTPNPGRSLSARLLAGACLAWACAACGGGATTGGTADAGTSSVGGHGGSATTSAAGSGGGGAGAGAEDAGPGPVGVDASPAMDLCAAHGLVNQVLPFDWGGGHVKHFFMGRDHSMSFILPPDVPAGAVSVLGQLNVSEGGFMYNMYMTISERPCDFPDSAAALEALGEGVCGGATSTEGGYHYATGATGNALSYTCAISPGKTYYANVRWANENLDLPTQIAFPVTDSCPPDVPCAFGIAY